MTLGQTERVDRTGEQRRVPVDEEKYCLSREPPTPYVSDLVAESQEKIVEIERFDDARSACGRETFEGTHEWKRGRHNYLLG